MTIALSHSPADVIREMLIDLSLGILPQSGTDNDWETYCDHLPDQPTRAVAVYDTAGLKNGRSAFGEVYQHNGIQILVRAEDHPTAFAKVNAIQQQLDEVVKNTTVTFSGSTYVVFAAQYQSGPIRLQDDSLRRNKFSLNYLIALQQSS